jgi:hypothetical protein
MITKQSFERRLPSIAVAVPQAANALVLGVAPTPRICLGTLSAAGFREGDGSGHPRKRRRASLRGLHEWLDQRRIIVGRPRAATPPTAAACRSRPAFELPGSDIYDQLGGLREVLERLRGTDITYSASVSLGRFRRPRR